LPVDRVCLVGSRGGVRTVQSYERIVDRFFSKARCVCRVVSRSGTFRLPVRFGKGRSVCRVVLR